MITYPTLRYCKITGEYVCHCKHEECSLKCPDNVCDGSGQVVNLIQNRDNSYEVDGTKACVCTLDY